MNLEKWIASFQDVLTKIKKQKLMPVLLVAAIGVFILLLGSGSTSSSKESMIVETTDTGAYHQSAEIEKMIRQISGVNKAYVFISYEDEGKTEYAYDYKGDVARKAEDDLQENTNSQMVIARQSGDEHPVVIRRIRPTVKGVTVIVQGDGSAELKYQIFDAVKSALGVEAHKIEVIVN